MFGEKIIYEEIVKERKNVDDEIKALEENEIIKRYIELCKKSKQLISEARKAYKGMKHTQYLMCNHLWVTSRFENDSVECRTYNYFGCIKCGLDQSVFAKIEFSDDVVLSFEEKVMYDFMTSFYYHSGRHIGLACDLELGTAIYKKLKENNPNISNEDAIKYFERALNDIRNIEVNDERKKSRAKRLSLNPNFNKWNREDVII